MRAEKNIFLCSHEKWCQFFRQRKIFFSARVKNGVKFFLGLPFFLGLSDRTRPSAGFLLMHVYMESASLPEATRLFLFTICFFFQRNQHCVMRPSRAQRRFSCARCARVMRFCICCYNFNFPTVLGQQLKKVGHSAVLSCYICSELSS